VAFGREMKRTGKKWFFKMAGGKSISNSPKNWGETGIFAEDDAEIKNTRDSKTVR